jgi:hypothetical protein
MIDQSPRRFHRCIGRENTSYALLRSIPAEIKDNQSKYSRQAKIFARHAAAAPDEHRRGIDALR